MENIHHFVCLLNFIAKAISATEMRRKKIKIYFVLANKFITFFLNSLLYNSFDLFDFFSRHPGCVPEKNMLGIYSSTTGEILLTPILMFPDGEETDRFNQQHSM